MHFKKIVNSEDGFTITELLVAMFISAIVMAGIYSTFYSQHKAYATQEQVTSMQQNLRAAVQCLESEIRMAGCDPTDDAGAGIMTADSNSMRITMDITDNTGTGAADGDALDNDEDITYFLDSGNLVKNSSGNILAENIDAIDFVYFNESGAVTASLSEIRSVQITLIARTGKTDLGYKDTNTYYNQQGDVVLAAPNDSFRRKRITTEVLCRNLGY